MDKLYTVKQVLEALHITESTFWRWVKKGTIVITRVEGRVYVKDADLQKAMK